MSTVTRAWLVFRIWYARRMSGDVRRTRILEEKLYFQEKIRLCPWCETAIEKFEGCDKVQCGHCKGMFHWNRAVPCNLLALDDKNKDTFVYCPNCDYLNTANPVVGPKTCPCCKHRFYWYGFGTITGPIPVEDLPPVDPVSPVPPVDTTTEYRCCPCCDKPTRLFCDRIAPGTSKRCEVCRVRFEWDKAFRIAEDTADQYRFCSNCGRLHSRLTGRWRCLFCHETLVWSETRRYGAVCLEKDKWITMQFE